VRPSVHPRSPGRSSSAAALSPRDNMYRVDNDDKMRIVHGTNPETTMLLNYAAGEARSKLSPMLDAIEKEGAVAIIHRRGFQAVLCGRDEQERILSRCFAFNPLVSLSGSGSASIWLPELGIYGHGGSLDEAEQDLIEAALDYALDWQRFLRYSANHAEKDGYVHRIKLAGDREGVHRILFGVENPE
jgi:hypothetical protein